MWNSILKTLAKSVKNASKIIFVCIIQESEKMLMILETNSVEEWNHHMKHIVMFIASTNSPLLLCFSFSILFKLHSLCVYLSQLEVTFLGN